MVMRDLINVERPIIMKILISYQKSFVKARTYELFAGCKVSLL